MKKVKKGGWSTRYKFKSLPKYVYLFQTSMKCKHAPFRVCKKVNGKTKTYGYFYDLGEAAELASTL